MIEPTEKQKLIDLKVLIDEGDFERWLKSGQTIHGPELGQITIVTPEPNSQTYTGIDALRKYYLGGTNELLFPKNSFDLMVEYYSLEFNVFFSKYTQGLVPGATSDRNEAETFFIEEQIRKIKKNIESLKNPEPGYKTVKSAEFDKVVIIEQSRYLKWLENKNRPEKSHSKNEIAMELIGLTGKENHGSTIQPVFYYIKDILLKYNISPSEAREIVNDYKGSVSPAWNKNVIPFIAKYLSEIEENIDHSAKPNETKGALAKGESENPFPNIFTSALAYSMFVELKNLTVKKQTEIADYAFIFHSMKKDLLIVRDTKHKTFIEFLNTKQGAEISAIKLPFKNQTAKKITYLALLKKYQNS